MFSRQSWMRVLVASLMIFTTGLAYAQKGKKPPKDETPPVEYAVKLLETRADHQSYAFGINDNGLVVGRFLNASGDISTNRAVFWTPEGTLVEMNAELSVPEGYVLRSARAANNAGQITGRARFANTGPVEVFRYDPPGDDPILEPAVGTILETGGVGDFRVSDQGSINAHGDIVCWTSLPDGSFVSSVFNDSDEEIAMVNGLGNAINDLGDVFGNDNYDGTTGFRENVFVPSRQEFPFVQPYDGNNSGDFAGWGRVYRNRNRFNSGAIRYSDTIGLELVINSDFATSINESGDVVGRYETNDVGKIFLYTNEDGLIRDIDDLVVAGADLAQWQQRIGLPTVIGGSRPVVINSRDASGFGQVAGTVTLADGTDAAFLLTPLP